ncbi:ATP-binding protein [Paenibacillus crassostreae]|uniref:histidine kinase n=1 Tax=Paenibacillus crassostreae TaxID=1763538 RepID=A0A167DJ91_9BACL|nr:ATP-binding protein [Paenibacillus crassostreae]AOZ91400.1 sensor histidine kinase [Paenibacillus crassostreae]OAB74440.1 histidine kinase [Paenibacillus crassostreae]
MNFWRSLVGKLWITIICLVACVLITLGVFLLPYIDTNFSNSGDIKRLFTYTAIVGFSMTTFFGLFLFSRITQPMQKLIHAANNIRKGEYGTRVYVEASDEIGELANTFNHMAAELEDNIRNLNQEKEHLSSVLRSMSDGVITFDNSGKIILTNPPGQRISEMWKTMEWDYEPEGSNQLRTLEVPKPLEELFSMTLTESGDCSTLVYVKQDVWSVIMTPLYSNNDIRGAVAVLRDVTEEVKLEKMRTDFVANVSHELRTPLSMMQGYSEALLDGMAASPEESQELIQVIHDESLRMGRLVKDLLILARMEAGHPDLAMTKLDVNELLERIYRKFSVRARECNLNLYYEKLSEDLFIQSGDEDKLEQVMTNLLDNAFRYTPTGKSVYIIAERVQSDHHPFLQIHVRDEGVGIPKEDIPFIFERFYKADKARVRGESASTGLGLAIVMNIIESHHGSVKVTSELGQGTDFIIRIPVEYRK